jgi:predicted nucleic acid-binding protein
MSAPRNKVFVDTNILVYAYDRSAGAKRETARETVMELWSSRRGLLSTQVLQEFAAAALGKIPKPLALEDLRVVIADLLHWEVVVNDGASVLEAASIQARYRLSFWDALIVQAAVRGGAAVLCSEDFTDGRVMEGVRVMNPFAASR